MRRRSGRGFTRATAWLACVLMTTLCLSVTVHDAWAEEGGAGAEGSIMGAIGQEEPLQTQQGDTSGISDQASEDAGLAVVPQEESANDAEDQTDAGGALRAQGSADVDGESADLAPSDDSAVSGEAGASAAETDDSSVVEGESALDSYDASDLLDDGAVYSISTGDGSGRYLTGASGISMASNANKIDSYWRVGNLGGGRYTFTNVATEKELSTDGSTKVGENESVVTWILRKCVDGMLSLVPEGSEGMRMDVAKSPTLASANGAMTQRFSFNMMEALTEALRNAKAVDEGLYKIGLGVADNVVVDIANGSTENGANVQLYRSNDSAAQRFYVRQAGTGLYTLESLKSGKCLDAQNGGTTSGTNVQQYVGNKTLAQIWYFVVDGDGYVLKNAKSGLALDVSNGSSKNGANIQLYRANGTKAQHVVLSRDLPLENAAASGAQISDGVYTFASALGNKLVLDIADGAFGNGGNVQVYASNGSMAQKFEVTHVGYGLYTIQAANSGKYLDAAGGGTTYGTNVQQYSYNGSRAQLWYFVKTGDGYTLCNAKSCLALDVQDGKAANKTNVQLYLANKTPAQIFSVNEVGLLADGTYMLTSALNAGQVLTISGRSTNSGANVQVGRMSRSDADLWVFTYLGKSTYRIINKNSGKALDVSNGSLANGGNIQQYVSNGTDAQKWILGISNTGALTMRNVKSGKYVDLANGKSSSGTNVQQYVGNDTAAQSFVAYLSTSDFVKNGKSGYQNPSQYYQLSAYNCVLPSYAKGYHTYVTPSRISPLATRSQCVEAFIARAYDYLNTNYIWDYSTAPGGGVDCSGLVMQCLYAVGMQTPYNPYDHMYDPWQDHNAENMRADSKFKKISFSSRQRGDLIFYSGHVAIYLGNNRIIHALSPSKGVLISNVNSVGAVTGCSRVFV